MLSHCQPSRAQQHILRIYKGCYCDVVILLKVNPPADVCWHHPRANREATPPLPSGDSLPQPA